MAFRDFDFPEVRERLGLRIEDFDLFVDTPPFPIREEIADFVHYGATLAVANATEKAKSEFIIAPILLELRRSLGSRFNMFSGVEWNVDDSLGLNGYCDFILGRGPSQHILEAPFVAIVEAKRDSIHTGLGQCIAAMVAARMSNERAGIALGAVHGVVSTGATWKFLRLVDKLVQLDVPEYSIDTLPRIMGILKAIVEAE